MKPSPASAENELTEGEHICRTCRHCEARWVYGSVKESWHLYCTLNKQRALTPCPGYEREPGTEGDDD